MSDWLIPMLSAGFGAVVGAFGMAAIQSYRSRAEKRARAKAATIEWQTPTGKWCAFGASARTKRDGELLQTWDQKSQDYLLLLNQEDYDASGMANRTDTVTVRWREDGQFVEAMTQCIGPDRKCGDRLMEIELRRDM